MFKTIMRTLPIASLVLSTATYAVEIKPDWRLEGYYKQLAIKGTTFWGQPIPAVGIVGKDDDYFLDLNRLRLVLDADWQPVQLHLAYDNEARFGNYLKTPQAKMIEALPDKQYLHWQSTYTQKEDYWGNHDIYRGYLKTQWGIADLTLGRQQVNWSTTFIWSPMDRLNPLNPIQLERDERLGVDAINLDLAISDLSTLSAVYAPARQATDQTWASRWLIHPGNMDLGLMLGNYQDNEKAGLSIATSYQLLGIRAEWVNTHRDQGYVNEAVVSLDYTSVSGFSLLLEAYFNGEGKTASRDYAFDRLLTGDLLGVGRHYLGAKLSKEWTPLLSSSVYGIRNMDDGSLFIYPELQWMLPPVMPMLEDLYLKAGAQLFIGDQGDEYDFFKNLYFISLKKYF